MRNTILRSHIHHAGHDDAAVPLALLGSSAEAVAARTAVFGAAPRRTPLLLCCEPGCRPREIAEALHAMGARGGAFAAIDCSATEAASIDRVLFGATALRPMSQDVEVLGADAALIAAADGTVFLDCVEELPAAVQRRLVRVLRDGEVRTATSRHPVAITCRVVAAATTDLADEVRSGRFRADLFRRLTADRVAVPSLRQRPQDLAVIVDALTSELSGDGKTRPIPSAAVTVLAALPWAENIDELAAVLGRVLRTAGAVVRHEDVLAELPAAGSLGSADLTASLRDARQRFEREYIAAVLERNHWRMSDAARVLGIERANLYRKTRQLGISRAPRTEQT
jgi:transcriptional regulator, propionate catabolism operon regulatory protein